MSEVVEYAPVRSESFRGESVMKKSVATSPAALLAATGLPVRRAFTVIELLVAIGAVAIVTVGLAAIFDAVGKTVQGGKRASALSQYATMVENQLRQDISSIDPNSFMVIRQQYVDDGDFVVDFSATSSDVVDLYRGQKSGQRPRRIDELMFFARGDFASVRTPIVSDVVARSREARVYYGHGQKMTRPPLGAPTEADYYTPEVRFRAPPNDIDTAMPQLGLGGDANRYASEWTLLRHVTVLQQPNATATDLPDLRAIGIVPGDVPDANIVDKDAQIALQPAAPTIFRTTLVPERLPAAGIGDCLWASSDAVSGDLYPAFATGMVDVATSDLSEIRTWILGRRESPWQWVLDPSINAVNFKEMQFSLFGATPGGSANNLTSLDRMHLWMSDAMPTQSLSLAPQSLGGGQSFETPTVRDPIGRRIRHEAQPQDLRTSLESSGLGPTLGYATRALQDAYERSAQTMLSAHNLVPRCSEFIVEWSFGRTVPGTNSLIWHGPPRYLYASDGTRAPLPDVGYYPLEVNPGEYLEEGQEFTFLFPDPDPNRPWRREKRIHPFTDRLIYGETPDTTPADMTDNPSAITSYFGYIDPTFDPRKPLAGHPGATPEELLGVSADSALMEWPRPTMIRITMSLADPQNPALEETFQFVLEVPRARSK